MPFLEVDTLGQAFRKYSLVFGVGFLAGAYCTYKLYHSNKEIQVQQQEEALKVTVNIDEIVAKYEKLCEKAQ